MDRKQLVFLHVPHTGGRVLIIEFKRMKQDDSELNIVWPHQPLDFYGVDRDCKGVQQYFILRPTVERLLGQFIHYTRRLQLVGVANHLRLASLPKGFQVDNARQFFMLEANRNLYCKYLLNRKDFSKPVSHSDFREVLALFDRENPPLWDLYTFPNEFPQLAAFLGKEIQCQKFNQASGEKRDNLQNDEWLIRQIEQWNRFDIALFEKLTAEKKIN